MFNKCHVIDFIEKTLCFYQAADTSFPLRFLAIQEIYRIELVDRSSISACCRVRNLVQ